MIGIAMYTTIKTLWSLGRNKSEISRLTGHDWKTVDKVLRKIEAGTEKPQYKPRLSIVEEFKERVLELLEAGLSGVRIHQELIRDGFGGSYSAVKKYIRRLKKKENIFLRINTSPAQEAQVDFGYVGSTKSDDKRSRKTWIFNMRLSYSRYDYYQKVYDQRVETFINCHINAFEHFGGVPKTVKIDNLKSAILKANFYEPIYQEAYKKFADYYGFKPLPCRVYHPNDKGKVESGIKYVKNNFFKGREFRNEEDLDMQLRAWAATANMRVHGTTRKVPAQVFADEERTELLPLPDCRFNVPRVGTRTVYHDCHIYVDYNYYSVPCEYVGSEVEIDLDDDLLRIYCGGKEIALHSRLQGRGNFSTITSHYPKYKVFSDTEYQQIYRSKMADIGPYAEKLFLLIVQKESSYWGRTVKGILSLSNEYPVDIVELACKRAYCYGAYQYQVVKRICANNAYMLPLEEASHEYA